jgi:hypothetical protein
MVDLPFAKSAADAAFAPMPDECVSKPDILGASRTSTLDTLVYTVYFAIST